MEQNGFDYTILDQVDHRPWPLPASPWVMTQTWNNLLFAHWPVGYAVLSSKIPPPLQLDLYKGEAWLGIVPFYVTNVGPRGIPALPWVSTFPELNVRTYVRLEDHPGVFFFSLDAGSTLAVGLARTMFSLPYYPASMDVTNESESISYRSRRTAPGLVSDFVATYQPSGDVFVPGPGSLEHFLTERYCLFTIDQWGDARRVDIHHPRWKLQPATATFHSNTMAAASGIALPADAPLLHFAKRQDAVAWLPAHVDPGVTPQFERDDHQSHHGGRNRQCRQHHVSYRGRFRGL